jgi:signal transduction histidine kinase
MNYINNAIKYGGKPPRVELGWTYDDRDWVRFWVRDNGQGLPPEEQDRLFTPFERLHQVSTEGYGLGLSIVRRIIEKLGGTVGVDTPNGMYKGEPSGCIFYYELPTLEALKRAEETDILL